MTYRVRNDSWPCLSPKSGRLLTSRFLTLPSQPGYHSHIQCVLLMGIQIDTLGNSNGPQARCPDPKTQFLGPGLPRLLPPHVFAFHLRLPLLYVTLNDPS